MKICIAGGQTKADFLIDFFLKKGHHIVVINNNENYSEYLAKQHDILVYFNDATKLSALEEAEVENFDVLIALSGTDADNLKTCQIAKELKVKKTVAVVNNPKNVDIFRQLGIENVISATYMASKFIEQASVFDNITDTLALENDKIVISNVVIEEDSPILNKTLMQINMPEQMTIGCILRESGLVIPKGNTKITLNDKLLLITSAEKQGQAISFVTGK